MSTGTLPDIGSTVSFATENPKAALVAGIKYGAGIVIAIWMLFPIYWMVATSIQPEQVIMNWPPKFLFFNPVLDNYVTLFTEQEFGKFLFNSLVDRKSVV